ncbi:hypothetical protein DFA_10011 [Cavenderia fasciculata]|uniref:Enoyl-CoA hydratase/isomerase domain-containing protein n=1 Tax=Cavenderia fasciculata TaxID=261658 RepID=F4Q916_CACFS|nr:uncharacterized protein DFA_10011 [Cavenderia fasciculata]EGG15185.1 hypothetical protein DFA_10011 [Cavenderia fasciculata]|eukprot:XP_004351905.1 hypothetical protein DFA_10011 [Cavenderia fasciculata]
MTTEKKFGHASVSVAEGTDDVYIIKFTEEENKFNDDNLKNINDALDYIESCEEASCLITIGTSSKFYSTGLDLDWITSGQCKDFRKFITNFQKMLARMLTLPIPTICVINGHAFAGGAMLACAHDYRIMRQDRGFFCLPEVDIHIPLTPGMNAILQSKMTDGTVYRDAALLGKRFNGKESLQGKIVDALASEDKLLSDAIALATSISSKGKDRFTFGSLKKELYKNATKELLSGDFGHAAGVKMFSKL